MNTTQSLNKKIKASGFEHPLTSQIWYTVITTVFIKNISKKLLFTFKPSIYTDTLQASVTLNVTKLIDRIVIS